MSCDRMIGPFQCCSVVCGDCLELMKQLPDGCVDAVITDPPYPNLKGGYELSALANPRWVGVARTKHETVGDIWEASLEWVPEAKRVADLGAIVFCTHHSIEEIAASFNGWRKVALLTWYKRNAPPTGANVPRFNCEYAWCFARKPGLKWDNFDSTLIDTPTLSTGCMASGEREVCGATGISVHPTQKPTSVMLTLCDIEADTIFDPFSGTGTTLVAAKKLGRHFLGFEISPEYCEIARKRLDAIDAQPSLFAPKPEQLTLGEAHE